jgi:type IV pilus assembly protein PilY1
MCFKCSSGNLRVKSGQTTWSCSSGGSISSQSLAQATTATPNSNGYPIPTLTTQNPTTASPVTGSPIFTYAVRQTCETGHLWNYSNPTAPTDAGPATLPTDPTNPNPLNTAGILDYNAIPGAYSVIPTTGTAAFKIAAEGAATRSAAAPILYNLQITQDGLLSLSYSYNGGTAVPVISSQKITNSNGPLPNSFRFGFAGSTGGSTNVHEILCFKAAPVQSSSSSGSVNVYQNPLIRTGTQIFIANYFPSDWTGQLEAFPIGVTASQTPIVLAPAWDARCVLSGVDKATGVCDATGASGPAAQGPSSRVMLTWDPVGQVAESFEWLSLTAAQQAALTAGDTTASSNRLAYLRGDTTNEIKTTGTGFYRARDAILSDIVDSSPTWIGPPQNPYTLVSSWVDQLYPLVTQPENATGAQTYLQYMSPAVSSTNNPNGQQQRPNIVYAGANDGFLHGFRAGALDVNGNLVSTVPNDGQEVLAYMPAAVLNNIHPVDANGNVVAQLDFSNTQYSHNWYVDATPAEGDVFYNNMWHTWVVSGLGPGGAAIFALDVTNPTQTQFTEGNASSIVMGEWTAANLTCQQQTVTACGVNLGNTYGTPQIRRFHNGQWGFIFGNGYGTANGASGIYIALLDGTTGKPTFYYFPTSLTPSSKIANGIGYVASADLDLDHTIDYIYAGDLLGNLWRFDVTSQSPASWGVSTSSPMFKAAGPITTQVQVSTVKTITTVTNSVGLDVSDAPQRVIINFGTGQQVPQSLTSSATYAQGTQYIYGIWDWDMGTPATSGWNKLSPNQQGIGLTGTQSITTASLTAQTLSEIPATTGNGVTTGGTATLSKNPVCWKGATTCSGTGTGTNSAMGWYTALPGTNEQIIFNPFVDASGGALIYNTYIPSPSGVLSCTQIGATGFSIGMDASTGAGLNLPLFNVGGTSYDGVQTNAIGTGSVINTGAAGGGKNWLVTHSANGQAQFNQLNNYTVTTGQRTYWIQKR